MALLICVDTFFTRHRLSVDVAGVTHLRGLVGGRRRFSFHEIDCVLMSSRRVLSFQVGDEVFSIPTDATDAEHQETIRTLVSSVRLTNAMPPPIWPGS